ncbi:MAG: AAA family ATPase, partial [Holosporaceae bacterium]|nr:AAA family ATPase [Holosporaceae bacterium]
MKNERIHSHRATEGSKCAHLQISRRAIGENGDFLERKDREICSRSALLETRKLWADMTNEFLVRGGFSEQITEKSFADLGINLEGTRHQGWYADVIGTDGRIAQENLEISRRNEANILADPSVILDYLNEKKSVFNQKDILNEISKRVFEEKSASAIFERVLEEAIYVGESVRGEFLYTGERYQKLESDVLSKFDFFASQEAQTICRAEIISSVLENYNYLSQEQKTAVEGLCGNGNISVLLGRAGAGKTTTMRAVSDIYRNSGARVIGMSISALASENLGRDAEIESATIAAWSHRWRSYELAKESFLSFDSVVTDGILKQLDWYNDLQRNEQYQLKSGDVIIVDEAGMVGTKEWKTVLDAAEKFGAKVIAVGDDNQFKPISAGDCFRHCLRQITNLDRTKFEDLATIASDTRVSDVGEQQQHIYELSEIRRQKEEWQREASVEFSRLNVGEALVKYEDHGRVHAVDNCEPYSIVAERYSEIEKLGTCIVLCSTNEECAAVNDEIRSLKKEMGELGEDLVKINGRNFAENDRIMFLKNDGSLGIKNGQCATVQGGGTFKDVDMLTVRLEDGRQLGIDVSEYDKITHAYAMTLHKSQGKTFDNTIVMVGKMMDAKAMYVGMTRHRENVDLYYKKSDFSSFKNFVSGVSKNIHKDSLADYQNGGNRNKTLVSEYQNLRLELSTMLKDINAGEASWKEYDDLKAARINLEKEILGNYESCRLYLNQLGITREKLEESAGLKRRAMTRVERTARDTVSTYVGAVREARELYDRINEESPDAFRRHSLYAKFAAVRNIRNDSAREIFGNYPLHREFVNEISKSGDIFICQETIKGHASPGNFRLNAAQANINVSLYASSVKGINESQKILQNEVDIQKLIRKKDIYGKRIAKDMKLHEQALLKYEFLGITKQSIEDQYGKYDERPSPLSESEKISARELLAQFRDPQANTGVSVNVAPDVVMDSEDKKIVISALISNLAKLMDVNKLSPKL